MLRRAVNMVRAYAAHPDPRVAAGNSIALLVASNQPFYPVYIWWLVSDTIWPAFFTFLSTPFFLAIPWVSRRNVTLARALLPATGIVNGIQCAWLFGVQSGVEMFLIPCVVLALLLFRPLERVVAYGLLLAAFLAYFALHDLYGAPAFAYSPTEYAAFLRLNALSAVTLTAFAALVFSNLLADAEKSAETVRGKISG